MFLFLIAMELFHVFQKEKEAEAKIFKPCHHSSITCNFLFSRYVYKMLYLPHKYEYFVDCIGVFRQIAHYIVLSY